jgi:hypothetical protein
MSERKIGGLRMFLFSTVPDEKDETHTDMTTLTRHDATTLHAKT